MAEATPLQRDLQRLETELKRLEVEYGLYFAERVPRPPNETRSRVENMVKRLQRVPIDNAVDRFRFNTIQSRFATLSQLWDRGVRAREEGRPGPFSRPGPGSE